MNKFWIDNADSYLCPECGFEVNNPAKVNLTCPRCGFVERRVQNLAGFGSLKITVSLRPCITNLGNGLFHRWVDRAEVATPSVLRGGHNGGQLWEVFGLVELEDGTVVEVLPNNIKFVDNLCEGFAWPDTQDSR